MYTADRGDAVRAGSVQPASTAGDADASVTADVADHGSRFSRDASTAVCRTTTIDDYCDGTDTGCCCNEEFCAMLKIAHLVPTPKL